MPHGQRSTYVKGCKCDPCRAANARYAKLAKYRAHAGHSTLVDSAPIRAHLEQLRAAGVGRRTIARQSGVSQTVINRLLGIDRSKPAARIRPETANRLLAVRCDALADGACIDATGTTRRLQALVTLGWSQTEIARRMGWTVANVNVLVLGRRTQVAVGTAKLVMRIYEQLSMTPGTSSRARSVAAGHGWLPPLAWDDDIIDMPGADARENARSSDRVRLTVDDIDELLEHGETLEGISSRFGIKRNTVGQIMSRARRQAS